MQKGRPEAPQSHRAESQEAAIAELRAELFDLRHVEKEFSSLNAQLEALECKYELLLDEKHRSEREQKYAPSYAGSGQKPTARPARPCSRSSRGWPPSRRTSPKSAPGSTRTTPL